MYTTFGSLNTSLQTLLSMQQSIQTSAHNLSNANTEGYSRQKTVLAAGMPYSVPANNRHEAYGQVGTGVVIENMQRYRDSFLDAQIRNETVKQYGWETKRDVLQHLEVVWNEPSDTALNSRMTEFWDAWRTLATTPQSTAARANVVEVADDLATTIKETYGQMTDLQTDLDDQIARHVGTINDLASRVADLNRQIRNVQGINQQPNDLLDQRDLVLTELSQYINIDINISENGSAMVSLGGRLLVMDDTPSQLAVEADPANSMLNRVVWADTGKVVNVAGVDLGGGLAGQNTNYLGGKLGGAFMARDLIIPAEMAHLNDIAAAIITGVNALQQTGYDLTSTQNGLDFFTGTGATDIAVNTAIKADTNLIAAAVDPAGAPADGSNALAIARLEQAALMNGGTTTINEYFRASLAELGQQTQQAEMMTNNHDQLVTHLEESQARVAGVSLDEETTNLLKFQHTYQAAARVMTTVDEMIDTIINKMGLVGR